ncbi:MAG: hypothetical protein HYS81_01165 [Candidatus Aenigmatarchaeota archaeon]|nr:MAG: hypothetical protein HYS81_01165 [Candidatus Aenigmarchaeota archaeon]
MAKIEKNALRNSTVSGAILGAVGGIASPTVFPTDASVLGDAVNDDLRIRVADVVVGNSPLTHLGARVAVYNTPEFEGDLVERKLADGVLTDAETGEFAESIVHGVERYIRPDLFDVDGVIEGSKQALTDFHDRYPDLMNKLADGLPDEWWSRGLVAAGIGAGLAITIYTAYRLRKR